MSTDDFFDIVHATIADLHVVSIKQLMQFVIAREMFVQDSEKAVGNIGFDIHVERGVEINDTSLVILTLGTGHKVSEREHIF